MSEILRELVCRQQVTFFKLFIDEKKGEKNRKFVNDFKTLADVLVQEMIKDRHHGKEGKEFTICPTEEETAQLLSKVLNGNMSSKSLAEVVHRDVLCTDPQLDSVKKLNIPQTIMGMWLDSIDSTNQHINSSGDIKPHQGVFSSGLQCITILIGVCDAETGMPLMGVINQPFVMQDLGTGRWKGELYVRNPPMNINFHSLPACQPRWR
uniref:Inositol polyphosphate-1-phosphatase n=1 Tax=Sphenodon punctatus TaxID=8508 RepID=A0A8D0HDA9_SPHPU